ncbi:glycosyltransferase family 10 domain-containing protein [Prochlorococcus marinus]|uniref:glycosyltransferase family 10 domain-containing protein n=1 Tax=Prochlorococcus marinus TaxID=1219 RepID=UPI0022B3A792|nr:glycosyltransferase family 10 [Prochlorococcus marinus]
MSHWIYPLWNPWGDDILDVWKPWALKLPDFDNYDVSISIDKVKHKRNADFKILYLVEPSEVLPRLKQKVLKKGNIFDFIYTTDNDIINSFDSAYLFEYGTSWLNFNSLNIKKDNFISFVTSKKKKTTGQRLRQEIYKQLLIYKPSNPFNYILHQSPPFLADRNYFFQSSKFHIAVENCKQSNYFTEKIIDCFASYTVPIYYGCPNLSDWFDMNGVICFETQDQLTKILEDITEDDYSSRLDSMKNNYIISQKFHSKNEVIPRITSRISNDINNLLNPS